MFFEGSPMTIKIIKMFLRQRNVRNGRQECNLHLSVEWFLSQKMLHEQHLFRMDGQRARKGVRKWFISWHWCPHFNSLDGACYWWIEMSANMAYFSVFLAQRCQSHQCKTGWPCIYSHWQKTGWKIMLYSSCRLYFSKPTSPQSITYCCTETKYWWVMLPYHHWTLLISSCSKIAYFSHPIALVPIGFPIPPLLRAKWLRLIIIWFEVTQIRLFLLSVYSSTTWNLTVYKRLQSIVCIGLAAIIA